MEAPVGRVAEQPRRLRVLLIKPTNYDDRGYPLRFRRGVLPSNTLAVMHALTQQAFADERFRDLDCESVAYDEIVWRQRVDDPEEFVRRWDDGSTVVVAAFVGVQSNQFPRAMDLARRFIAAGARAVIGGFHVSGTISTLYDGIAALDHKRADVPSPQEMPEELREVMADGVILCHGEGDLIWADILSDIVAGRPRKLYRGGRPDLKDAPLPDYPPEYFRDFVSRLGTFDTGRGCPFACSFCTVINVQGRDVRWRDPQRIIEHVRRDCEKRGVASFFFTDDNFARNPHWCEILDGLIALRREGKKVVFMIEADLAAYKLPGFVDKLSEAGCLSVFLGMESVRQETLQAARKPQNLVKNYKLLCDMLHERGISVHVGYIIGFPADTVETVLEDIETIKALGVDQASFFVLTPLPGSEDHVRMLTAGTPMDADLNRYDSFRPVVDHPRMTRQEWSDVFMKAFREFYRPDQMIRALERLPEHRRWWLFRNFMWYRNSVLGERTHPMMCGFWSVRKRRERRPGLPLENPFVFWARESAFRVKYLGHLVREFYVLQQALFESTLKPRLVRELERRREALLAMIPALRERLVSGTDPDSLAAEIARWLSRRPTGPIDWLNRTFRLPETRAWLDRFWPAYRQLGLRLIVPRRWRWHLIAAGAAITELVFALKFLYWMVRRFHTAVEV